MDIKKRTKPEQNLISADVNRMSHRCFNFAEQKSEDIRKTNHHHRPEARERSQHRLPDVCFFGDQSSHTQRGSVDPETQRHWPNTSHLLRLQPTGKNKHIVQDLG